MPYEFTTERRVEFSETDAAGIVHFANFFRYMESTEHAFFRLLGYSIHDEKLGVGWPRVKASCDYRKPLKFEDFFQIRLLVEQVRTKAITYRFVFTKTTHSSGIEKIATKLIAIGSMTSVCVQLETSADGKRSMKAVPIPQTIKEIIVPAPKKVLEELGC